MNSESNLLFRKYAEYSGHRSSIYKLSFHKGKLYSTGSDRLVVRWDSIDEGVTIASSPSAIYSMCFPADDNILLLGNADGLIHIIDLNTGKEIRNLKPVDSAIFGIVEIPDLEKIFMLSGEGVLSIYEKSSLKFIRNIHVSGSKIRTLTFDKARNLIVVGCGEGKIHAFDVNTLDRSYTFQAHQINFSVNSILVHPETLEIISGSRDGHINVYSTYDQRSKVRSVPAHNYAIYAMEFLHEKLIVSASRDKTLKIWDAKDQTFMGRIDSTHEGHNYSVNTLCVNPENNHVFSAGDDKLIKEWIIRTTS